MSYNNFNAAIYCPVGNLIDIKDIEAFAKRFEWIERNVKVGKVYLETYRGGTRIEAEQLKRVIAFFQSRGIATSGGITTDTEDNGEGGFYPLCYTSPETRKMLTELVEFTAGFFDEIILDDFFFTNCKCKGCIQAKGQRTWAEFRLELLREISETVVVAPAKRVNPKVSVIIKYPNWYEHYQDCGYNPERQPAIFDAVYTGTETRNPTYTQQHLPKYLSYFNMRYHENTAPGRNGGGWFDPYECTYNLTSYAEQGYLTLLAKAKEATLFSLGSLLDAPFSLCIPVAGQVFSDMDDILPALGNPTGVACYLPFHSHGEDYLHNYLGMLGIPLEPSPAYPDKAKTVFLTESAAMDGNIVAKMQHSLLDGGTVIVTSGFVRARQREFSQLADIRHTGRKALVNRFAYSFDGGVTFGGCVTGEAPMLIPQLEYPTNDTWELIGAFGEDNSFPILVKTTYGDGRLFVLTVPEDYGTLYHLPRAVLAIIRGVFAANAPLTLDAPAKTALFLYDNDTFVLRGFAPYYDTASVTVKGGSAVLKNLTTGQIIPGRQDGDDTVFALRLAPGCNAAYGFGEK